LRTDGGGSSHTRWITRLARQIEKSVNQSDPDHTDKAEGNSKQHRPVSWVIEGDKDA
jgi:hypothetical protein